MDKIKWIIITVFIIFFVLGTISFFLGSNADNCCEIKVCLENKSRRCCKDLFKSLEKNNLNEDNLSYYDMYCNHKTGFGILDEEVLIGWRNDTGR